MEEGFFQIFVALPTDDVCTVRDVSSDMRIFQLKSRIELKTGVPGDIQHLYFMNKELYDDLTLKDVKFKQGCIVRLKFDSNWESLFDACWRGDNYEVFQNGVQFLDEREFQGYNIALWNRLVIQRANHALFIASHRGFLGLVIEILNHSAADINGKTRFGRTALHVASYQGFVGCVSLLLSEGALCNQIDFNGKTALALAIENGHMYCERRLWLYQLSIKAFSEKAPRKDIIDSRNSQETTENLNWRFTKRNSGKSLKFKDNQLNGEVNNKIQLHLPRVQISSSRSNSLPSPSHQDQEHHSQFPLVQIAEKYRQELKRLDEINVPDVEHDEKVQKEQLRPQTALGLSRANEQATGSRDAVEQVQSVNYLPERPSAHDSDVTEQSTAFEPSEPAKKTKDATMSLSSAEQTRSSTPDSSAKSNRPVSGKPRQIRKLDVVISSSRERTRSDSPPAREESTHPSSQQNDKDHSSNSEVFIDVSEFAYRRRKPAQTFDNWLEMKRNQNKMRPATGIDKRKLGKSIDPDAFKQWLDKKRHYRSLSESSNSSVKKSYISTGQSFDEWLQNKTKAGLLTGRKDHVTDAEENGGNFPRKTRAVLAGKTYEEWLNDKLKQTQATQNMEGVNGGGRNASRSGKSFEVWLLEKRKQKQIEIIHKETTEQLEQKRLEFEQYQRYLNPNHKTFDEWLAIKKQEHLIERFRAENEPKESEEIPREEKEKDANLVFDIWLTMKYVQEMKVEEDMYKEMVTKWEKKEKQRAQLRRAMLANKARHYLSMNSNNNGLVKHVRAKSAEH